MKVPVLDPKYTPSSALANPVQRAVGLFRHRAGVGYPGQCPQSHDGPGRPRLLHGADSARRRTRRTTARRNSPIRSAQLYPLAGPQTGFVQNSRQVTVWDPNTKKFSHIDTCFGTHHLNFAEDANNTLWLSNNTQGERAVVGWINTKLYWQTGDAAKSQGWTAADRRHQRQRQARRRLQRARQARRLRQGHAHSVSPCMRSPIRRPTARSGARTSPIRATSCASIPGSNPADTAMAEIYKVPLPGFGIRGSDVDRNGVVWMPLDSGHIASFDRRKCKGPLNGPGAELGEKCPEGFAFYPIPGPGFQGDAGRRGESVLHLGRPAQHSRPRRRRAARHRQPVGFAPCAGRRPRDRAARALSDGLLRQGHRRPHRR